MGDFSASCPVISHCNFRIIFYGFCILVTERRHIIFSPSSVLPKKKDNYIYLFQGISVFFNFCSFARNQVLSTVGNTSKPSVRLKTGGWLALKLWPFLTVGKWKHNTLTGNWRAIWESKDRHTQQQPSNQILQLGLAFGWLGHWLSSQEQGKWFDSNVYLHQVFL